MTGDPLPSTADALDALYRSQEDPFGARTNPEKRVRYGELARLLPGYLIHDAADLACGEGDFTAQLARVAERVTGVDLSESVIERAKQRVPTASFQISDVRDLTPEWLGRFDLICWLDAIYWLTPKESVRVLERIAEGTSGQRLTFLVSSRIVPAGQRGWYWAGHDFETPGAFLDHVRLTFPEAYAVPVQLHLNLRPLRSLTSLQRVVCITLKTLTKLGGYRLCLRLAQRASRVPFLAPIVDPFVVHAAAAVYPGNWPYPTSVEDTTDRFLNRPLAGWLVRWLMPTAVTPNQLTAVSCVLGLAAAATLSLGSWPAFILGALLLQLSVVVDCADGQLARAKGLGSHWGEVFDHTSDDLTFFLVSLALCLTVWQTDLGPIGKLFLVTASFAAALLLTASQYFYNEEYRTVAHRGVGGGVRDDRERVLTACRRPGQGWRGRVKQALVRYYAFRLGLMYRGLTWLNPWRARLLELGPVEMNGRRTYWELQAFPLWLWRLTGMSSVALLLVMACLGGMPVGFAWLLAAAGLPYFMVVLLLQRRADHVTFSAWTK